MGSVRDMAHSADMINWDARKRVEELSQRPASPSYIDHHKKRTGDFIAGLFCAISAVLLVATYVMFF